MACIFPLCSQIKHAFSFQRANSAKTWNMTAKIAKNDARTSQVDQFAVVTARPRLGTWPIVTSRVEGTRHVCCLASKECRITATEKRLWWSFIPLYECGKLIMYSHERRSIAQQTDGWDKGQLIRLLPTPWTTHWSPLRGPPYRLLPQITLNKQPNSRLRWKETQEAYTKNPVFWMECWILSF